MDRERPKPPADTSTSFQAALDTIADMRELVIRRRADQDANVELLRGVQRRPVIHLEHDARNSDGNPNSPQIVVFLATIVDVTVGS